MKRTKKRLRNSSDLKYVIPTPNDDKRIRAKIKIMTQTLSVGQAQKLAARINKFVALAS